MDTYKPSRTEHGWEIFDGFAYEPNSKVYTSRALCQVACDRWNSEAQDWNTRGLADAPHMDNY